MSDLRVPVTLLTGFLGAGKTTLLNALLTDDASGRIAVVVNEFGDAGLDHDLIEASSEEVILMESGCLCCSVRGDLSRTLLSLCARRGRGEVQFDRIVVETTGLAHPGPILATLSSDRFLARAARVDGVVTVVDAVNGTATLDDQFEAVSQVAVADLIVLSKTDRVPPEQAIMFEKRLTALNPSARLVRAVRGAGLGGELWGLSGLRRDVAAAQALNWVKTPPDPAPAAMRNLSGLAPATTPPGYAAPHDARIGSASITLDTPIEDTVFDTWLDTLVGLKGNDILRVKGIVFLKGIETPFVIHGVGHVFDAPVPIRDWPGGNRVSRIVVIGRDVTRLDLQRSFDMLRAGQGAGG